MDDLSELNKIQSLRFSKPGDVHPFDESISSKESFYSNQSYSKDSEELKKEMLQTPIVSSDVLDYSINYLRKNRYYIYNFLKSEEAQPQEELD